MSSANSTLLVVAAAIVIRGLDRDGLLLQQDAARVVLLGADTMVLIDLHRALIGVAATGENLIDPNRGLRKRGDGLNRLALEMLHAGGWRQVIGAAPAQARATWDELADDLRRAHDIDPRRLPSEPQTRPMIRDWRAERVDRPGRDDHGWPLVTGRISGDPRFADGEITSVYAVIHEGDRSAFGMAGLVYALGDPA